MTTQCFSNTEIPGPAPRLRGMKLAGTGMCSFTRLEASIVPDVNTLSKYLLKALCVMAPSGEGTRNPRVWGFRKMYFLLLYSFVLAEFLPFFFEGSFKKY